MASVMANGMAGNKLIEDEQDPNFMLFQEKLKELLIHLAKLIISDGEGASKFIEYKVMHARNVKEARQLIRVVSDSSLVKTAMFGRDPNWGRILAAMGRSGVEFNPEVVDLYLGNDKTLVPLLEQGIPVAHEFSYLKRLLKPSDIKVHIDLNDGEAEAVGWGADLTTDYVMFNSVYST
jgi:glutamate N-acetyltransferase/amino-acid N-acetyltransferase